MGTYRTPGSTSYLPFPTVYRYIGIFLDPKNTLKWYHLLFCDFLKFLSNFNYTANFLDLLGRKRNNAQLVKTRCVFYTLWPSKKSQTKLPGGRFTPTVSWTNFRKIGKTEKCRWLILSLTPGK